MLQVGVTGIEEEENQLKEMDITCSMHGEFKRRWIEY
jgi:hypothetical protein